MRQAGGGPQKWMASCDYSEFEPNRYCGAFDKLAVAEGRAGALLR
jgi:hypothetical protein